MVRDLTILTEREKQMKRLYEGEGRKFLSRPMSYAQYKKMIEEHPDYPDVGFVYEEKSMERLGTTAIEVEAITSGDLIDVQPHERYGYPVLHNHVYIEMIYVYSGTCTHFIIEKEDTCESAGAKFFQMKAGDVCLLAPNVRHVITALADDVIVLNVLLSKHIIDTGFLALLKDKYLLADFFKDILYEKGVSSYILFPTGEDIQVRHIFGQMYQESERKEYAYRELLILYTKQLLTRMIRYYQMQAIVAESVQYTHDNHIVAILGYISVNYNQVTLKETAEFFNYSEAYLSRMLKKYTSKTFVQIVSELQMKHAKELIEAGKLSLAEISQEVGCFDASHFTKKFKKQFGISPDEYRKQLEN